MLFRISAVLGESDYYYEKHEKWERKTKFENSNQQVNLQLRIQETRSGATPSILETFLPVVLSLKEQNT